MTMGKIRARVSLLMIGGSLVLPVVAAPSHYIVNGLCEAAHFAPDGRRIGGETAHFDLVVSGCTNQIHLRVEGDTADYRQITVDSQTTYYLTSFQTALEQLARTGQATGENVASGTALPRPVPNLASYSPAGPVWLAFASGCYFADASTRKRPPPEEGSQLEVSSGVGTASGRDVEQTSVRRMADWGLAEASGLPTWVTYYEAWDSGKTALTNSTYAVVRHTNIMGLEFPAEAVFTTYWLTPRRQPSSHAMRSVFRIEAREIKVHPQTATIEVPPLLPGKTLISEGRFVGDGKDAKGSWSYMAERRFPSVEDIRASRDYAKASPPRSPLQIAPTIDRGPRRLIVVAILAAVTLIPLLFVARRLIRASGETRFQTSANKTHNK